jgi:hypothetical protein
LDESQRISPAKPVSPAIFRARSRMRIFSPYAEIHRLDAGVNFG